MNALSIVQDALKEAAKTAKETARQIVCDALIQSEFAFDGNGDESDAPDEGDGGEEELGDEIKVEKVGDDSVRFTFKFKYSPKKYDSTVDDGAKQVEGKETVTETETETIEETEDVAEDATAEDAYPTQSTPGGAVANASAKCKATFEQCKAKNPYACKYHGQKLIEADIYALLAANGAKSAKVDLKKEGPGAYEAAITCIDTPAERKAAAKAIKAFLKKKGIDKDSTIDTGYDKEEKAHSAFFDVDDLDKDAKSEEEMHVEHKEVEVKEEKTAEKPEAEPETKAVPEKSAPPKDEVEEEAEVKVKENVEKPEAPTPKEAEKKDGGEEETEDAPFTDDELIDALKGAFGDKIEFGKGSYDFNIWKKAIIEGKTGNAPLSEVNQGYLQEIVDYMPDDNPVAEVAAATLEKLKNGEIGGVKKPAKPKKQKKANSKEKNVDADSNAEQVVETSQTSEEKGDVPDGNGDNGFSWNSPKGIAIQKAYADAVKDYIDSGAETNADCKKAHDECYEAWGPANAANKMVNDFKSEMDKVDGDDSLSPSAKAMKKDILSKSLEYADDASYNAAKGVEAATKKLVASVGAFKAKKMVAAMNDAVKLVDDAVDAHIFPEGLKGSDTAYDKMHKAMLGLYEGDDVDKYVGHDKVKSLNEQSGATAAFHKATKAHQDYNTAMSEYQAEAEKESPDPEKVKTLASAVEVQGKKLNSAYDAFKAAVGNAKGLIDLAMINAKKEAAQSRAESDPDEPAQAAQSQQQSKPPADKSAIKAKIAAMTPKEKAEKAIEILNKKIASDPGNEELKKQLQKFQALAAKLG